MSPYRRLLCPVDFSEISRRALERALKLSKEIDAELTVLHVLDTGLLAVGNLAAVPDAVETLRTRAEEAVAEWKLELDLSRARVEMVEGVPSDVIVESADPAKADLLVMGTHGHSGFQKLFLGSVTEKVLHRLEVPLLTVSARAPDKGGPVEDPARILAAVDFGPESESVVQHAIWFAEHYRAQLLLAHVVPVPYVVLNDRTLERLTPEQLQRLEKSLTEDRRRELGELLPESGPEVELSTPVGPPFESLRNIVTGRDVDLVVLGAGGHGRSDLRWLGSTCHKMVRSSPCPVLIVR